VVLVCPTHENQYNDRLKSTAKGLEQYGSCRILSVVHQLPAQKLTVLETVEGLLNSNKR
jgi:hypothetical protein